MPAEPGVDCPSSRIRPVVEVDDPHRRAVRLGEECVYSAWISKPSWHQSELIATTRVGPLGARTAASVGSAPGSPRASPRDRPESGRPARSPRPSRPAPLVGHRDRWRDARRRDRDVARRRADLAEQVEREPVDPRHDGASLQRLRVCRVGRGRAGLVGEEQGHHRDADHPSSPARGSLGAPETQRVGSATRPRKRIVPVLTSRIR